MTKTLKAAVIGLGAMGKNHARVCADMGNVTLCAVSDISEVAAAEVADKYRCHHYVDHNLLLDAEQLDFVVIAVPTIFHRVVALDAIRRGVSVLIEKPIALNQVDADVIIAAAQAANVTLAVGHIERFNPAVLDLKSRLDRGELGRVLHIEARRQGPFPTRIQDVGVITDLAVHDVDLIRFLTGAEVSRVYAETTQRVHQTHEDLVRATLRMTDGTVCSLSIDWLTPTKIRELIVTGERGMFHVNLLTQDLTLFENGVSEDHRTHEMAILRGITEGKAVKYVVAKREPLRAEIESFCNSLQTQTTLAASGADGKCAVSIAQAMLRSSKSHSVESL